MEGMASVFTSSGLENVSQASAPKDFRQFPLDPISLGLIHFIKQNNYLGQNPPVLAMFRRKHLKTQGEDSPWRRADTPLSGVTEAVTHLVSQTVSQTAFSPAFDAAPDSGSGTARRPRGRPRGARTRRGHPGPRPARPAPRPAPGAGPYLVWRGGVLQFHRRLSATLVRLGAPKPPINSDFSFFAPNKCPARSDGASGRSCRPSPRLSVWSVTS